MLSFVILILLGWELQTRYHQGHNGQNSGETRCRGFLVLKSRCHGFSVLEYWCRDYLPSEKMSWYHNVVVYLSVSPCHGVLVVELGCCGFLGFFSPCCCFLVLESRCCGVCASTTSFSLLLNLLCNISNVDTWIAK